MSRDEYASSESFDCTYRRYLLGALLTVAACSHSPVSPSGSCLEISGHGSFCAAVNAVAWSASSVAPKFVPCVGTNPLTCAKSGSIVACRAFDSQGTAITFLVNGILGTQHFGSEGDFCCQEAVFTDANGNLYGAEQPGGSATFTITSLTSSEISGTFSFVAPPRSFGAVGQQTVTNGRFDVTNFSSCIGN